MLRNSLTITTSSIDPLPPNSNVSSSGNLAKSSFEPSDSRPVSRVAPHLNSMKSPKSGAGAFTSVDTARFKSTKSQIETLSTSFNALKNKVSQLQGDIAKVNRAIVLCEARLKAPSSAVKEGFCQVKGLVQEIQSNLNTLQTTMLETEARLERAIAKENEKAKNATPSTRLSSIASEASNFDTSTPSTPPPFTPTHLKLADEYARFGLDPKSEPIAILDESNLKGATKDWVDYFGFQDRVSKTHLHKGIAGASNDCWLRSTWSAIFQQNTPEAFKATLEKLFPQKSRTKEFEGKFQNYLKLALVAEQAQNSVRQIFTQANADNGLKLDSKIQFPHWADNVGSLKAEELLKDLTFDILKSVDLFNDPRDKDGDSVVHATSLGELESATLGSEMGVVSMIFHLCRQMETPCLMASSFEQGLMLYEGTEPTVMKTLDDKLALKPANARKLESNEFMDAVRNLPVISHKGRHYEVFLSNK